jgi:hypothetical protein
MQKTHKLFAILASDYFVTGKKPNRHITADSIL